VIGVLILFGVLALLVLAVLMVRRATRLSIDRMAEDADRSMGFGRDLRGRPQPVAHWVEPERGVVIARIHNPPRTRRR
jgi:hypothetical protein